MIAGLFFDRTRRMRGKQATGSAVPFFISVTRGEMPSIPAVRNHDRQHQSVMSESLHPVVKQLRT
jgi:hypothetical protein